MLARRFENLSAAFRIAGAAGGLGRDAQSHPRAAATGRDLRSIEQLHPSAVLLQNAPDDGKTKARAFLARRHIRLEQPVAVLLRQTGAVVDHVDHDLMTFALDRDADAPASERLR